MSEIREEKDKGMQERDALGALLESQRRQEALARRGLWHQRIRTGIAAVVAVAILALAGTASATLHDVQILAGNASYAVSDLHATVRALELQETLAGIDALVQDGSDMIESSAEDIEASLRAIASLDVEGLNESIRALEAVTTAMGRLFGYQSEN